MPPVKSVRTSNAVALVQRRPPRRTNPKISPTELRLVNRPHERDIAVTVAAFIEDARSYTSKLVLHRCGLLLLTDFKAAGNEST